MSENIVETPALVLTRYAGPNGTPMMQLTLTRGGSFVAMTEEEWGVFMLAFLRALQRLTEEEWGVFMLAFLRALQRSDAAVGAPYEANGDPWYRELAARFVRAFLP